MDQNLKNPLISVTICTYNRAQMISKAIYSALKQTYQNIEIIVVDDASTDDTKKIIGELQKKDSRIKYFKNKKNLNIAGTRNETIKNSKGEYIAILDSDDFWTDQDKIKKQIDFLEKNLEYALIGTSADQIDKNDNLTGEIKNLTEDEDIRKNILIKNEFVHSTVVYRKSIIEEFGFFDESKSPFEDYDLILKIGRKYKLKNLEEKTASYRVHSQGESKKLNFRKKLKFLFIIFKNIPYYENGLKGIKRRLNL